ncbi:nitrous oxide reductase accessory protein NosL [Pseudoduganella violacea]|uniref:Nitrous oxide reductase accessory protein NosL n=1 Tax=Pseudoduganella violacea TaxID=1715466 RepID=A0A7W5BD86_9BURK|nr:nitrous oxide reductase accessory protein NosL [Pseudoduganella violacea]MBB3120701.1 nitrous oxide reductase accessory protein NosL [Pseudoduganella violacea]
MKTTLRTYAMQLAAIGAVLLLAFWQTHAGDSQAAAVSAPSGMRCAAQGQIHYRGAAPSFHCDLAEMFALASAQEQRGHISTMFVRDSGASGEHWIPAAQAQYIGRQPRQPLLAFADKQRALDYASRNGIQTMPYSLALLGIRD